MQDFAASAIKSMNAINAHCGATVYLVPSVIRVGRSCPTMKEARNEYQKIVGVRCVAPELAVRRSRGDA